ncbi:cellulose biosynthesis protein BcsF [Escherichia coli]|nr:cellulose biosynthesis protein BcsF [Escherichia coli]MCV3001257.1 cellulose biosynthesis protein BcsF [Escherichia coli]
MTISEIIEIIVVCALIFFPLGYLARHSLRRIRDTLRLFFLPSGNTGAAFPAGTSIFWLSSACCGRDILTSIRSSIWCLPRFC